MSRWFSLMLGMVALTCLTVGCSGDAGGPEGPAGLSGGGSTGGGGSEKPPEDEPVGPQEEDPEAIAELEELGLPYAIIRPTVIFGEGGILINNIAWLLRHLPLFAVVGDGRYRMQPVYALIPRSLLESLQDFLDAGDRKIDLWYARHNTALADFSDVMETFFNINTEEDLRKIDEPGTTT